MKRYRLGEIAAFVEEKISSSAISLDEYVTTDSLLQDKRGRTVAQNLPPQSCNLTRFKKGDVLIGNIRPYLKKIWLADIDGGCSLDVLALRAINSEESTYLYALLMQDDFYKFVMKAPKGSKMPRGDKNHILTYPCFCIPHKEKVGHFIKTLDDKIALNRRMNEKLETMAKRLYDRWFVQFDFPDADGRPYKTSGGKMAWNAALKREIPAGWEVDNLYHIAEYVNGLACQNYRPKTGEDFLPVIKIKEMHDGITAETEKVSASISEKYKVFDGDILFSWSASLEVMFWCGGDGGLNQHIFKVIPKTGFSKEFVFHQLSSYIVNFQKMAEARKTTMGHITSDHIHQSCIALPPIKKIEEFSKICAPLYEKIFATSKEVIKLTALRDRLLPLLMNGQVAVG